MQKDIKPDSKGSDEPEVLSILIKEYESEYFPVPKPDPIAAIKFRLDQMNMSEAECPEFWAIGPGNRKYFRGRGN